MHPLDNSPHEAFCTIYKSKFHANHGGMFDYLHHKVQTWQKRIVKSMPDTFFMKGNLSICINKSVMLFSLFFVECNVPLSITNHVGHLFKTMFPDLKPPRNMLALAQK